MNDSKQILIVDDDSRNIFALSAVLKSKGFKCVSANGMADAFRLLNEKEIGIVLLDMMMPDMDGYQAIPELRDRFGNELPIIAVTAQAMMGDRERCLEAGADGYIPKPVNVDDLLVLLKKHL